MSLHVLRGKLNIMFKKVLTSKSATVAWGGNQILCLKGVKIQVCEGGVGGQLVAPPQGYGLISNTTRMLLSAIFYRTSTLLNNIRSLVFWEDFLVKSFKFYSKPELQDFGFLFQPISFCIEPLKQTL